MPRDATDAQNAAGAAVTAGVRGSLPFIWATDIELDLLEIKEIVEGVLTSGGMSVMYGESNSGKSYLAIHLGICLSLGFPWLGRQVHRGAVAYVAGEGAASVKRRLVAHRKKTGHKLDAFGLIPTALNLLDPATDIDSLIMLIRDKQSEIGQKIELVIVDTVARAMQGADENSGKDMSCLVRAADRIRETTQAHVLFIHHSGKDTAKGARGHSSLRAALDTEIEVKVEKGVHTATVTKQRDLNTNALRLAAKFVAVELGKNQWGKPITACVVEDAAAPELFKKPEGTNYGKNQRLLLDAVRANGPWVREKCYDFMKEAGLKKRRWFEVINSLLQAGVIEETAAGLAMKS